VELTFRWPLAGHQTEGIFRLSPSVSDVFTLTADTHPPPLANRLPHVVQVSKLKDQFNAQNYELTTSDPHVVASCLKLWFRELSQPLIPHEF
jgi:hypothetical protein